MILEAIVSLFARSKKWNSLPCHQRNLNSHFGWKLFIKWREKSKARLFYAPFFSPEREKWISIWNGPPCHVMMRTKANTVYYIFRAKKEAKLSLCLYYCHLPFLLHWGEFQPRESNFRFFTPQNAKPNERDFRFKLSCLLCPRFPPAPNLRFIPAPNSSLVLNDRLLKHFHLVA